MEVANHLAPYLDTIHTFLSNDAKTHTFPNLTMSMEDVLARIVDDSDFLRLGVDGDCKSIAAKIIAQLEKNKCSYMLSYKFENNEIGKRVMVYKKTPVQAVLKEPEAMKPLRRPNRVQASSTTDLSTKTVMSTFKAVCLNATLKFVKNDDQMLLQYPGITTEQSEFIKCMIAQCSNPTAVCDTGFKGLYDPLAEALKILSLKYEFELTDFTPEGSELKRLKLEKKLKTKRNTETKDLKTVKEKEKKLKQVQPLIQTMSKIDAIFLKDAILKIRDFISNRDLDNIIFPNVSSHEMVFLSHWNTVVNRLEIIQMFDVDVQMALDVIREGLKRAAGTYKLIVTSEVVQVRNVTFMKAYSQKSTRLLKSSENQHSQSTQDSEAHLHSTQGTEKHSNSTQVINSNSDSTPVIEILDSDKEIDNCSDDLRKCNSTERVDVDKIPIERSGYVKPKEKKKQFNFIGTTLPPDVPKIQRVLYDKEKVPAAWIRTILLRMKKFIETESEASILIRVVGPAQKAFASKYTSWLYRNDCVDCFSDDLKELVVELQTITASKNFDVQGYGLIKPKKQSGRDFQFNKVPSYNLLEPLPSQKEPNNNENKAQNLQSNADKPEYVVSKCVPSQIEPKANLKKVENAAVKVLTAQGSTPLETRQHKKYDPLALGKEIRSVSATRSGNVKKAKSVRSSVSSTLKKSSSVTSLDKWSPNKSSSVTSLDKWSTKSRASANVITANMPRAKVKLIEGLNQPLVSEKGLRMMRMMGWDGGALGARGDGIVEPITLQLDLSSRAGLGAGAVKTHTKQIYPVTATLPAKIVRVVLPHTPTKTEFISGIVGILHKMITTQMATELVQPSQMTDKNWAFVKQVILQLNWRSNISLESPLLGLVHQINGYLMQCDYIFNAIWGTTRKNILFILTKCIYQIADLDPKDWCAVVNVDPKTTTNKLTNKEGVAQTNMQDYVMVPGDAFRYYVLSAILDFCRMSTVTIDKEPSNTAIGKTVPLKGCLTQKQRNYIKDVVRRVNRKSRASTDSSHEQSLFEEIVAAADQYTVQVDFPLLTVDEDLPPVYKSIRLHKIFDPKTAPSTNNKSTGKAAKISSESKQAINKIISTNKNADPNKEQKNTLENINTKKLSVSRTSDINKIISREDKSQNVSQNESTDSLNKPSVNDNATGEQNVLTDSRNEPMDEENQLPGHRHESTGSREPTVKQEIVHIDISDSDVDDTAVTDCLCCLPDYVDSDDDMTIDDTNINKVQANVSKHDQIESYCSKNNNDSNNNDSNNDDKDKENVEYIFIENVTCKSDSLTENKQDKTPIVAVTEENQQDAKQEILTDVETPQVSLTENKQDKTPTVAVTEENQQHTKQEILTDVETSKIDTEERDALLAFVNLTLNDEGINKDDDLLLPAITKSIDQTEVKGIEVRKEENVIKDSELRKRIRSNPQTPIRSYKKRRVAEFIKHIRLRHKDYPQVEITLKMAGDIQKTILENIDYTQVLPLLKCYGIQDGGLVYSCHSQKSLDLIENVAKSLDLNIESDTVNEQRHKMIFKMYTYITEEVHQILDRLSTFNLTLDTKQWLVTKKEQTSEYIIVHVEIDDISYKFIQNENFVLYAGIDAAKFSIVWT